MRALAVLIPLAVVGIAWHLQEPARLPQPVPREPTHEAAWFLVMRHSAVKGGGWAVPIRPIGRDAYSQCLRSIDHAAVQRSRGALTVRCEDRGL